MTQNPALTLDKTVTSTGPYDSVGDVINYLLVATNTGNVTLHNVTISRSQAGHAHLHADPAGHAGSGGHVELHRLPHGRPWPTWMPAPYYNIATADSTETVPVTDEVTVADDPEPGADAGQDRHQHRPV